MKKSFLDMVKTLVLALFITVVISTANYDILIDEDFISVCSEQPEFDLIQNNE